MQIVLLGLVLLVSLSSCSIFRDVSKSSNKFEEKREVTEDKKETTKEVVTDKTVIVTTEEVKEEVKSPEKQVVVKTPIKELQKGGEPIVTMDSTGLIKVSILLDSLNNLITTVTKSEETLTKTSTKTTNEYRDVITETDREDIVRREEEYKLETKDKNVEKEGKNSLWFTLLGLAGIAGVIWLIFVFIKSRFK